MIEVKAIRHNNTELFAKELADLLNDGWSVMSTNNVFSGTDYEGLAVIHWCAVLQRTNSSPSELATFDADTWERGYREGWAEGQRLGNKMWGLPPLEEDAEIYSLTPAGLALAEELRSEGQHAQDAAADYDDEGDELSAAEIEDEDDWTEETLTAEDLKRRSADLGERVQVLYGVWHDLEYITSRNSSGDLNYAEVGLQLTNIGELLWFKASNTIQIRYQDD